MDSALHWFDEAHRGTRSRLLLLLPRATAQLWGGGDQRTEFAPEIEAPDDFTALCELTEHGRPHCLIAVRITDTHALVFESQTSPGPIAWLSQPDGGFLIEPQFGGNREALPTFLQQVDIIHCMNNPDGDTWKIAADEISHITLTGTDFLLMDSLDLGLDGPQAYIPPLPVDLRGGAKITSRLGSLSSMRVIYDAWL